MKNIIVATLLLLLSSNVFACYDEGLSDRANFDNCLVEITHENIDFAHNIKTDRFAFTNAQDECYEYSYLNRKDIKNHTGYDIEIFSEPHEKHLASEPLDFENIRRYFTPKEHLVESCASLPSSDWSQYSYSEELIFFNKNIISVNKGRGEYYAGNRHGEYISQKLLLDFKKRKKVIWSDIFGRGSEEFEELVYEWVFENHADKNYIGLSRDSVYVFKRNFTIHPRGLVLTIPTGFIGMYAQGELTFLVPKTLLKKYISTKKYDYYFSNPALSEAASFDCNKASTSHEKMICNDPTLSALDGEMGRLYKQVLALDPQQLKEQRKFNKKYRECGELDKCISLVESRNRILEYRVKAEQNIKSKAFDASKAAWMGKWYSDPLTTINIEEKDEKVEIDAHTYYWGRNVCRWGPRGIGIFTATVDPKRLAKSRMQVVSGDCALDLELFGDTLQVKDNRGGCWGINTGHTGLYTRNELSRPILDCVMCELSDGGVIELERSSCEYEGGEVLGPGKVSGQ